MAALDAAQQGGICEVVTLPDATPEQVVRTFQSDVYRDRIGVLHFAGHAGPEGLLFETADGSTAVADAGGLAAFLGCQRGLQLVVLNACATQAHVDSLRDAGVGAVVATSKTVEDEIAHQFAVLLYQGLGSGAGIKRAYDEAAAGVRFKHGALARGSTAESMHASAEVVSRDITRKNPVPTDDGRWPWDLYFRRGAEESVGPWALPEAAGNPLFGLPTLPETDQPIAEPFRHLRPFSRVHAEVFFGRGKDIRELYDKVTSAASEPVVLLYGATGVGKSSLLDAGLLPRLTTTHEVRYAPRNRALGLVGTLAQELGVPDAANADASAIAKSWRELETSCGKPLFVVVDQLEEAYTAEDAGRVAAGAGTQEIDAFARAIAALFASPTDRPRGRLVLGFRKEWLSEVKASLEAHRVPRTEHRLEQLTRSGVIEAITGPTRVPARRMPVRLELESGLAVLIADDLLANRASHVAPLLQILLATMWTDATRADNVARFDSELYETVQKKSKQLAEFLDKQLDALRQWNAVAVDSGLALDFLRYYTTPKGSADEHTIDEEQQRYPNASSPSPGLRAMCARLFLLVERVDDAGAPLPGKPARLAHDTLAPIVRERFDRSDLPGPRAKRILDGRSAEWQGGKIGVPLDAQDLGVVEAGEQGMRAWNDEEKALVAASRVERDRARRRRAWVIRGAVAAVVVIAGFGVGSWILYRQSQARFADSTSREFGARALATDAQRRDVALLYGVAAYEHAPTFEARRSLFSQIARNPQLIRVAGTSGDRIVFSPDATQLVTTQLDDLYALDIATGEMRDVRQIPETQMDRQTLTLDPTGEVYSGLIAVDTIAHTQTIGVWNIRSNEKLGQLITPNADGIATVNWRVGPPNAIGKRLVAVFDGSDTVLWSLTIGQPGVRLRGHKSLVQGAEFSPDGSVVVTSSDEGRIIAFDVTTGRPLRTARVKPDRIGTVAISHDNSTLAVVADDTLALWDLRSSKPPRRTTGRNLTVVAFTADDSSVVVAAGGGEVRLYSLWSNGEPAPLEQPDDTLHGAGDVVQSLAVSATGKRIAALSPEGTVHVWDLALTPTDEQITLPTGGGQVSRMSADGRLVSEITDTVMTTWELATAKPTGRAVYRPPNSGTLAIGFSVDIGGGGRYAAAPSALSSGRGARGVFDMTSGRLARRIDASDGAAVVIDPANARVAYGLTGTRAAVLMDVVSGNADTLDAPGDPRATLEPEYTPTVAFNAKGTVLAVQTDQLSLTVWDLTRLAVRETLSAIALYASQLLVSDDGQTIAAVHSDMVQFWRAGKAEPVAKLRWNVGLTDVALSPDGSLFAFQEYGLVTLVDVARGEPLGQIGVRGDWRAGLAFVDGGRALRLADGSGRVVRIPTNTDAWVTRACSIASSPDAMARWVDDAPAGSTQPIRCGAATSGVRQVATP